ncbi:MAG: FxLYD domain-containing protein [Halalkalicoccus sp.]
MRRRELLASVLAAPALAGCVGNGGPIPEEPTDPDPDEDDDPDDDPPEEGERVEIAESLLVRRDVGTDEETVSVWGVVVPIADVEVSYVEVRAGFFDGEGDLVDTTIEQVEIDPDEDRWEFEVTYPGVGEQAAAIEEYELEVGTEL